MNLDLDKFISIVKNEDDEENHTHYEMCKNCTESCCSIFPCELFPEDISKEITYEAIVELLNTNLVCIDSYEDFEEGDKWYVRMKTVGEAKRGSFAYRGYGGPCCILTENGCKLKFENRPFSGRFGFPCKPSLNPWEVDFTKKGLAEVWKPYFDILQRVVDEYGTMEHVESDGKPILESDILQKIIDKFG